MKLLLKQRIFSWLDNYDVGNESNEMIFRVKGAFSWGHLLKIYDQNDMEVGCIKERVITFLPKFEFYCHGELIGEIKKELTFFKPMFHLSFNDWEVKGNVLEWEYDVRNPQRKIMSVSKKVFSLSDSYELQIEQDEDALYCLMIVLAIDAIKCKNN